jgi:ATP-dependent Clp protease protease subunit
MSAYTIPNVVERLASGGERVTDVFSRLLSDRIVYLGTPIDDGVANTVIAQLLHLESASPDESIDMYLNSSGGDASAVLPIVDTMTYVRNPVRVTCVGQAVAAAALVLASGEPGARSMLAHARVVLAPVEAEARGAIPDLILQADEVERVRLEVEQVLAAATGRTPDQVRDDTARQHVLDPVAAVRYGVVDEVLGRRG